MAPSMAAAVGSMVRLSGCGSHEISLIPGNCLGTGHRFGAIRQVLNRLICLSPLHANGWGMNDGKGALRRLPVRANRGGRAVLSLCMGRLKQVVRRRFRVLTAPFDVTTQLTPV